MYLFPVSQLTDSRNNNGLDSWGLFEAAYIYYPICKGNHQSLHIVITTLLYGQFGTFIQA